MASVKRNLVAVCHAFDGRRASLGYNAGEKAAVESMPRTPATLLLSKVINE
jgi:hypothetical protein